MCLPRGVFVGRSAQRCVLAGVVFAGGECLPRRGVCQGVSTGRCPPRGMSTGGCLLAMSAQEGVCQGGVCLGDVHPPWAEFLTHAYENITFPRLRLGTVTRGFFHL